jgi:hypothetical protein
MEDGGPPLRRWLQAENKMIEARLTALEQALEELRKQKRAFAAWHWARDDRANLSPRSGQPGCFAQVEAAGRTGGRLKHSK